MSEEEIIEEYKNIIYSVRDEKINLNDELNRENIYHTLWRFLDLYQKEKEKNKKTEELIREKIEEINEEYKTKNTPDNTEWYIDSQVYGYANEKLQELLEERN
jgi:hypothetical protein